MRCKQTDGWSNSLHFLISEDPPLLLPHMLQPQGGTNVCDWDSMCCSIIVALYCTTIQCTTTSTYKSAQFFVIISLYSSTTGTAGIIVLYALFSIGLLGGRVVAGGGSSLHYNDLSIFIIDREISCKARKKTSKNSSSWHPACSLFYTTNK